MARFNQSHTGTGANELLREKAGDVKSDVQELGRIARDVASETYENLRENASEYLDKGQTLFKDFEGQFTRQIRAYPMRSLAIAAGVGLIFGAILKRSKSV